MNNKFQAEETSESGGDGGLTEAQAAELEKLTENTSRKLLTLLVIGGILLLIVHVTPIGEHVRNWDTLAEMFKAGGVRAEVYFLLISAFLIMAGVPRLLFCALGGFAFGFWQGLFWSLCSSLIGSYVAFEAARWGGREWLTARFGKRPFFARIVHATPTIASVVLIRMLPVANAVINVGLALSRVRPRAFLLGSLIGFLPQGVVAVVIGSGMAQDVPWAGAAQSLQRRCCCWPYISGQPENTAKRTMLPEQHSRLRKSCHEASTNPALRHPPGRGAAVLLGPRKHPFAFLQ